MGLDAVIQERMLRAIPSMRAFARSLCRNRDRADDLVQETLLRAIDRIETFENGSNLEAWLFTIMRNKFNSDYRKAKLMVQDEDGRIVETLAVPPEQVGWAIARDLREGLGKLPPDQRRALFLVGAEGLSYDEAAVIAGSHVGTIKSRVSRARAALETFLSGDRVSNAKRAACDQSRGRCAV